MSIPTHIIEAAWDQHRAALQHIRKVVFIDEQEVPKELEWDGEDEDATHFLAVNELGEYVGCARLLPSGQIGRMAVLTEYRGTNIGAQLLTAAVAAAQEQGMRRAFLHAQSYAEAFYRKGGFVPYGDEFDEAGIPHIAMELKLPLPFEVDEDISDVQPSVRPEPVRETLTTPETGPTRFHDHSDCLQALTQTIAQARRRLLLLNPFLDHDLFDRPPVAEAISQLARSAPRVEIKIIVFDTKLIVDRGHSLVELARRLDDNIHIRVLSEMANAETSSFVCADLDAYWLLPSYEQYEGISEQANPVTTARLVESFNQAWEKSVSSPELRTLRL